MSLPPGTKLGAFEILDPIGSGGMGEVYRARDTKLGRDVAIKILPAAFTDDPDRLARFTREARVLASLNHANIATIHGIEEAGGVRGLVLELIDGDTLAGRIAAARGRGLPPAEYLAIARQSVDALDAAHQQGIVHRDLKPANVKITRAGVVKVLDFGLAKAVVEPSADASTNLNETREGLVVGTVAYMSPEQARGQDVDKRTDIWAFGCVLYEMVAGRTAFGRATTSDTIAAVLAHQPDWSACPPATPAAILRLMRRCLEPSPQLRLRDIADARFDLDAAAAGEPIAPASAVRDRSWRILPWAAAGAVAGAIAMMLLNTALTPANPPAPRLSRPVKLTTTPGQEFGPAISPDGEWVAYYATSGGRTDLIVKFLESGATSNLTAGLDLELPTRSMIGGIGISPNGRQIAFTVRQDPALSPFDTWVIAAPVGGSPPSVLAQVLQGVQWSPDGRQIAAVRPGSTHGDAIVLGSHDGTGQRDLVPAVPGRHLHWPAWSADSRFVYFIHTYERMQSEPTQIYRVAAAGGAIEPVIPSARRALYPVPLAGGALAFASDPDSVDLGLWWKAADGPTAAPLTVGVGEYQEPRVSADGRRLVATLVEVQQSLLKVPIDGSPRSSVVLTDGRSDDSFPSLDPGTDRIVFSSTRSGHRNLWIARADATGARPLTSEPFSDDRPVFSSDGRNVAFLSNRSGRQGIWVIGAAGGSPKLLTEAVVLDTLAWTRDGTRVIFARPEGHRTGLAAVSVSDGKVQPIATPEQACCPAASPVDDVLAYLQPTLVPGESASGSPSARQWVRFVDYNGRPVHGGMPDVSIMNGFLAWTPDGRRLAGAAVSAAGPASLYVIDPGASEPSRKVFDFPGTGRPDGLTWTRDGTAVIVGNHQSTGDIVLFDVSRR